MYLVATRIRRLCWARNPVVTSSRSAMVRTSIQACGTATTTLALPKPRLSINSTFLSASVIDKKVMLIDNLGFGSANVVVDQQHVLIGVGDRFAHQVLAGDAEMHRAARQLRGDLARR